LLWAAELKIVAVYEDGPTSYSYFSASRGTADAGGAIQQAEAVGQPKGSAIYFTVDYDAASDEISGNITAYFEAVAAALNGNLCGGRLRVRLRMRGHHSGRIRVARLARPVDRLERLLPVQHLGDQAGPRAIHMRAQLRQ